MLYAFVLFMGIIGVCAMLMNDIEDMIRVLCIGFIIIMTPFEISLIRHYLVQLRKLRRCSAHTQGTIISVDKRPRVVDLIRKEEPDGNDYNYSARIEYTVDSTTYITYEDYRYIVFCGTHEKIHYNPSDPQDCHVGEGLRLQAIVSSMSILLFLTLALFILIFMIL